jgi:AcrR family transcriptional regulator
MASEAPNAPQLAPEVQPELHQRQRMLMGMAQVIAKHGYRGATITEVVRYAKVSKRTFYEEFDDKESCFLELYGQTAELLEGLIVSQTDVSGDDWREQIGIGARAYFSTLSAEPLLARAFFIEISTLSERAMKVKRDAFDHFALLVVDLIERARAAHPEIPSRSLTPMMAAALMGGMTDVMIGAIERDEMVSQLDEIIATCTDLIAVVVTGEFPPGE